jgi:hypothetical protein
MHNNDDCARFTRHIDAILHKKAAAHAHSQALQRYDQAGLQALHRAMVPPCLARSMWASMHRQGWSPGVEAQMRVRDVYPDDEPRKYATLTVAVATALARLTRDAALAECCRAYHASCEVYQRAVCGHARLMDELMLEAARLDTRRRASDEAC